MKRETNKCILIKSVSAMHLSKVFIVVLCLVNFLLFTDAQIRFIKALKQRIDVCLEKYVYINIKYLLL